MGKRRRQPRKPKGLPRWGEKALISGKYTPHGPTLKELKHRAHIPTRNSFEQMKSAIAQKARHDYYDLPITPPPNWNIPAPKTAWEAIQLMNYFVFRPGKMLKLEIRFSGNTWVIVQYDYLEMKAYYSHVYNSKDAVVQRLNYGISGINWRGSVQLEE